MTTDELKSWAAFWLAASQKFEALSSVAAEAGATAQAGQLADLVRLALRRSDVFRWAANRGEGERLLGSSDRYMLERGHAPALEVEGDTPLACTFVRAVIYLSALPGAGSALFAAATSGLVMRARQRISGGQDAARTGALPPAALDTFTRLNQQLGFHSAQPALPLPA